MGPGITSRIPRYIPSPAPQKHCPLLCPDGPEAASHPPEASGGVCLPSEQPAQLGCHQQPPLTSTRTRQRQRGTREQAGKGLRSSLTLFTQENINVGGDAQGSVGYVLQQCCLSFAEKTTNSTKNRGTICYFINLLVQRQADDPNANPGGGD